VNVPGREAGEEHGRRALRAVALGGGHGLHATLSALRTLTEDVVAVVTVADDGGSSGRLRRELGVLPPGDLRMALSALAGDGDGDRWARVFQHRFRGNGALAGHAVGNLLLAGLVEVLADPVAALDEACRLLGVRGRVLPMCTEPLDIEADVTGLNGDPEVMRKIRGQVAVATTPGRVHRVRLLPEQPIACPDAVAAVRAADLIVLGPGSWFTSVLPHLLVPALHRALVESSAYRVVVLNLVPQPGETAGFSPEQHLDVLSRHAPALSVDAVLADSDAVTMPGRLTSAAVTLGGEAHLGRLAAVGARDRHDPAALAAMLTRVLSAGVTGGQAEGPATGGRSTGREEQAAWQ
jgi:uncharacterized cofD-like protein